jgi:hypothetical protein
MPGPDGTMGTDDDVNVTLGGFSREIRITDLAANLRQIDVTVTYHIGSLVRQYNLVAYISSFA